MAHGGEGSTLLREQDKTVPTGARSELSCGAKCLEIGLGIFRKPSARAKRARIWRTLAGGWLTVDGQLFSSVCSRTYPSYESRQTGCKWDLCVVALALVPTASCAAPSPRHEEAVPPVSTVPTGA